MNGLMLKIRNHYIANKIIELTKEYFTNFEKIMKRLKLTILTFKRKRNCDI